MPGKDEDAMITAKQVIDLMDELENKNDSVTMMWVKLRHLLGQQQAVEEAAAQAAQRGEAGS
jgi:hypothetical protein